MKTIFKIIIKVFIWLAIIFIILAILINYYWWLAWKIKKWENFCINEKYSIWKMTWWDNLIYFCDNTKKGRCLSWINKYILWNDNDLYMSFNLGNFTWLSKDEVNEMVSNWYMYYIFQNDYNNKLFTRSYDDVKRFLRLDYNSCEIEFYSNNDLNSINIEEKELLKSL